MFECKYFAFFIELQRIFTQSLDSVLLNLVFLLNIFCIIMFDYLIFLIFYLEKTRNSYGLIFL